MTGTYEEKQGTSSAHEGGRIPKVEVREKPRSHPETRKINLYCKSLGGTFGREKKEQQREYKEGNSVPGVPRRETKPAPLPGMGHFEDAKGSPGGVNYRRYSEIKPCTTGTSSPISGESFAGGGLKEVSGSSRDR